MDPWHIVGAAFSFFLKVYKRKDRRVIERQLPQSTPQPLGQGPCALRLEMDSTLTFHPMGWRVGSEGEGWGAGLGDRVLSF